LAGTRHDNAAFVGEGDELGAVAAAEFAQGPAEVGLGGERADDEAPGDVGVAEADSDEADDLLFASVSSSSSAGLRRGSGRAANWAISRLVTEGASRASPAMEK